MQLRPDGAPTVHHIFPRSQINSDSYFVEIEWSGNGAVVDGEAVENKSIVPHAVGLCGSGTSGHHGDVEEHRAWIKLEDGVFIWYDRAPPTDPTDEIPIDWQGWTALGSLNPQPGSREGKKTRKRLKGEQRRKRKTISVRVPDDTEDGGAIWDDRLERVKEKLVQLELYSDGDTIPAYEAIIAALDDWLQS